MKRISLIIIALLIAIGIAGGAFTGSTREDYSASLKNNKINQIYIRTNGWHTGIVVPVNDIPDHLIPEKKLFGNSRFIEIGWGDAGFYQAKKITLGLAAKALLTPTRSVLHLAAFNEPVPYYFAESDIVKLKVTKKSLKKLLTTIHYSFKRKQTEAAEPFRVGLYGFSFFFNAKSSYHAFRTCNRWTADTLKNAGVPITTWYVATSDSIMSQLAKYGEKIR